MAHILIAIEGRDGVGKTSLRKSLYKILNEIGLNTVTVPSHSWLDRRASRIIGAAKYLGHEIPKDEIINAYLWDKQCLANQVIIPKLKTHSVICDRYLLSDMAYLNVIWGIPIQVTFETIMARALVCPSVTIMVESDITLAMERLHRRDGNKLDRWETKEYQTALNGAFHKALSAYPILSGHLMAFDNASSIESLDVQVERNLIERIRCHLSDKNATTDLRDEQSLGSAVRRPDRKGL